MNIDYGKILKRDNVNLAPLRPAPRVSKIIAAQIVEDLEAALEQFALFAEDRKR